MAWPAIIAAIIAAAGSVAGGMMGGSGGGQAPKTSPTAANDPLFLLRMRNQIEDIYRRARHDPAPSDFRIRVGGQEIPMNLATWRRQHILNEATPLVQAMMGGGGLGGLYPSSISPNSWERMLPIVAGLAGNMNKNTPAPSYNYDFDIETEHGLVGG